MRQDVRWKQRFQNFDRAQSSLQQALANGTSVLSALEKEGVVQRFEYSFELAWKTLKDYLEQNGLNIAPLTPRHVIKTAFSAKLLDDGQVWIDMLDHRNSLSHQYDSVVFDRAVESIASRYLPAMVRLHGVLEKEARLSS